MKRILVIVLLAGITIAAMGATALALAPDTSLSNARASFWGEDADDYSGISVSNAGDVNGDTYDDFLIGASGNDDGGDGAGQTYLILGSPTAAWGMDFDLSNADASFWGEDADDHSGRPVSGAGDVNGDGYDDILIGAYLDDDGGSQAGQTYLILGKPSGWAMDTDLSTADASFWGEDGNDLSGSSVSGVGDVNGDTYDDFLIGAYSDNDGGSDAGQTYLILGSPTAAWGMDFNLSNADASFWGEDAYDYSGHSVSGAGDVNGDTYDDFLIGAYGDEDGGSNAGQTYLILGSPTAAWGMDFDLSNADASFWGEDVDDESGYCVSGSGDVNGDTYDDFLIGARGDDDGGSLAGQTYLILGLPTAAWGMDFDLSNADASFWGEDVLDLSGWSVSGAGDVNGDIYDDFLIGARGNWADNNYATAGQTYLILGSPTAAWGMDFDLSNADASFWGEDADDHSGHSVSNAGDVNGDGFDDFLIGAAWDEDGGSIAGQTYLIMNIADIDVQGNGSSILDGDTTPSATDDTDFGALYHNIGSADHVFTIENTGFRNLNLPDVPPVVIGGPNMADFTVTVQPGTQIASGSTTAFTVRFDPIAAGTRSAFISIANNDPDEDPYNFNIQGVGLPCSGESRDDVAVIKDVYSPGDIVYANGFGFTPLANVEITVVADRAWTDGMTIPADITGFVEQLQVDATGNIPLTQIWAPPLPVGEYDIVFNIVRQTDTTYDIAFDDVDDPNHPGFVVRVPGSSGPTVGGQVMLANKFELLTQYLSLPMRLVMGFAF